jgi:hypothetical protein
MKPPNPDQSEGSRLIQENANGATHSALVVVKILKKLKLSKLLGIIHAQLKDKLRNEPLKNLASIACNYSQLLY